MKPNSEPEKKQGPPPPSGCKACLLGIAKTLTKDCIITCGLTPTIVCNFVLSKNRKLPLTFIVVLVIVLSFVLKSSADTPFFHNIRYDDACDGLTSCAKVFEIKEEVTGPVYLYIYFEDFFINHRNVVRSVSRRQIAGEDVDDGEIDKRCPGFRTNSDKPALTSYLGASLVQTETLSPCGIYPSLVPGDMFSVTQRDTNADKTATGPLAGDTNIVITSKEKLAWEGLKGKRFKQHATAASK